MARRSRTSRTRAASTPCASPARTARRESRTIKVDGHGFYDELTWSPDGKKVSYVDNSQSLYWLDLETGTSTRIDGHRVYTPTGRAGARLVARLEVDRLRRESAAARDGRVTCTRWSRASRSRSPTASATSPTRCSIAAASTCISSDPRTPGRRWTGSRSRTPTCSSRATCTSSCCGTTCRRRSRGRATRRKPRPPRRRQEAERDGRADGRTPGRRRGRPRRAASAFGSTSTASGTGFSTCRSRPGRSPTCRPAPPATLYYMRTGGQPHVARNATTSTRRKPRRCCRSVDGYRLSADGKKMLYRHSDPTGRSSRRPPAIDPTAGRIRGRHDSVKVDPRAEWRQIFDEAWRINRDYFYAPNMHGVDWAAMKKKYEPFLADLATRSDLNRVIQWMSSRAVGRPPRVGGGDIAAAPATVPGGLLGADYCGGERPVPVQEGLRRPELESAAALAAHRARRQRARGRVSARRRGQGRAAARQRLQLLREHGRQDRRDHGRSESGRHRIAHRVGRADRQRGRPSQSRLGRRQPEEGERGDRAAASRTSTCRTRPRRAHEYFKRYFFPQTHKDAVIVDERFNGGGQVADYYIDLLRRPLVSYWAMRYGEDLKAPAASIQGPKVMIIDETAGSGGDLLPWMFRKFQLGPLVGQRTWGGLVGTLGFPVLMDGGAITAPNLAIWTRRRRLGRRERRRARRTSKSSRRRPTSSPAAIRSSRRRSRSRCRR